MAIVKLEKHVAELIAAGEVVERPASVAKELAENAVDAGARSVEVDIERGGVALLRVADDGCGIEAEDLPLAFVRHATSKLKSADDLEAIETLGFRGEALASIASVARVEVLTRAEADEFASLCQVAGGGVPRREVAGRARGTTITVRDLFYNTPARMKFLKKDASEGTFVAEAVARLALGHPEVAFRFKREGRPVFATPGDGQLAGAVWAVLGKEFARGLVQVEYETGLLRVRGLVTPPAGGRASRGMQHFFINGRFVKNRTMLAAMEQAYRGLAMQGRFPGGVLFLQMPPGLVDVNVHPAKTEVRFAREKDVFDAVYQAVKAALVDGSAGYGGLVFSGGAAGAGDASAVAQPLRQAEVFSGGLQSGASPVPYVRSSTVVGAPMMGRMRPNRALDVPFEDEHGDVSAVGAAPAAAGAKPGRADDVAMDGLRAVEMREDRGPQQPEQLALEAEDAGALRLVGEIFKTYIVAEVGAKLCLIDKHAAHERILYEGLAAGAAARQVAVQQLLAPVPLALAAEEKAALLENAAVLAEAGVEVDDFGGSAVLVRGVPADIAPDSVEALIEELAARLVLNHKDSRSEKAQWVLHSIACRAAVKAGARTPPAQLLALAEDILAGRVPPFCPHGRPVVLQISRAELEKQFGRLG